MRSLKGGPNEDLQCQLEREYTKEARWRQVAQPRSAAAQIQSPQVIQAKPFLLSIHVLTHRMRYPSPDASRVSETKSSLLLVLTPIFHANLVALQASSISSQTF